MLQKADGKPTATVPEGDAAIRHNGWWFTGTKPIIVENDGQHRFSSPNSAARISDRLATTSFYGKNRTKPRDDPRLLPRSIASHSANIPSFELAQRLCILGSAETRSILCFIGPDFVKSKLDSVYCAPLDLSQRATALDLCQVLILCAFGELCSNHGSSNVFHPPGSEYFEEVLNYVPAAFEGGSVQFVEVLCCIGFYLQTLNRHDSAFLYTGLALRMAVSLGLQVEIPYMTMSSPERNHTQRVWWSVYCLDRIMSVKNGNPITIRDSDINASFPKSSDTILRSDDIALRYRTELARILGNIGEDIYRKWCEASSSLLTSITRTFNELNAFAQSMPGDLLAEPQCLDLASVHEAYVITLLFHGAVMMAARPLVFYVAQRRLRIATSLLTDTLRPSLSTNVLDIVGSTVASARATALLLGSALSQGRLATFSHLEGEQAFAASLILIMTNAAFPEDQTNVTTTETALSVLKSMGERGNEYSRDRHNLLSKLRQNVCPHFAHKEANPDPQPPFNGSNYGPESSSISMNGTLEGVTNYQMPLDFDLVEADLLHRTQDNDFDLDVSDDPGLWDDMLHGISINMDVDWIDATLGMSDVGES